MTGSVFAQGFLSSEPVHVALSVSALVAVVSAIVGTFTVMRGQSFAGHSLADIGTAGGAGSFLVGVNVLSGFVAMNVVAAGVMGLIGIHRARGRDIATGIVLGAALGLSSLFLYLDTTTSSTTGATMTVLFGSMFTLLPSIVPFVAGLSILAVATVLLLYRPLLLSSVSSELAAARGVRVKLMSVGYLLALALAVSLSAVTIGTILSTALLIGPAATATRLTKRPPLVMLVSAVIGVVATFVGVALAYESYYWSPHHQGWPVSFFVVAVVFISYLVLPVLVRTGDRRLRTVDPR
jgi:zinc/manganese transport system permease protein